MAEISVELIKKLKELSGAGLTDAKKALVDANGDFDKALEEMRKKGLTKAEKRGDRETREGLVEAYIHDGRLGAIVEVNCETSFVAKTDEFKTLAHQIAMQIASMSPLYVSEDDIPEENKRGVFESEWVRRYLFSLLTACTAMTGAAAVITVIRRMSRA